MMAAFTESGVEAAALAWLEAVGWRVAHGPDISPNMPMAEWADYGEAVLARARVTDFVHPLNNGLLAVNQLSGVENKRSR